VLGYRSTEVKSILECSRSRAFSTERPLSIRFSVLQMTSRQDSPGVILPITELAHPSLLLTSENQNLLQREISFPSYQGLASNNCSLLQMTSRQGSLGVAFRPTDQELLCLLRERLESGTGHDNIEDLLKTVSAIDPDSIIGSTGESIFSFSVVQVCGRTSRIPSTNKPV
jgi:hypothetical protein